MKKGYKKWLLPISLASTIAGGTVIGQVSHINEVSHINKYLFSHNSKAVQDVQLTGSLTDNFNVQFDNGTNLNKQMSLGLSTKYWNLTFNNNVPVFNNFTDKFIATLDQFDNQINELPNDTITKNGISLSLFKTSGQKANINSGNFNYSLGPNNKYGFKTNNNINDPNELRNYRLTTENRLLKINYVYGWDANQPNERVTANSGPFNLQERNNGWGFNGYVGLDSNVILSHYAPEVSTELPNNTLYCFPRLVAQESAYDTNTTALNFVKSFSDQYKNILRLQVSNNLPINQITNLRLRAVPQEGKVLLVYDLINGVKKENGWYSDVDTTYKVQDQTIEIASGFWVNTEQLSDQISGEIITQGYIPSEVDANLFRKWIFSNRSKIWNKLPDITINDIEVKADSRQISNDDSTISFEVALKKKYEGGEEITITSVRPSDYVRISINNFNRPQPTTVEANPIDRDTQKIIYQGKELLWKNITANQFKDIIKQRVQSPTPGGNDTTLPQLIELLVKIGGGIPIVNAEYAKITTIDANGIKNIDSKQGTLVVPFVVNYAYEEKDGRIIKVQNKAFDITITGLSQLVPTAPIPAFTVDKSDFLSSTLVNNQTNNQYKQTLIDEIKDHILKTYQDNYDNQTIDPQAGGFIPTSATKANITTIDFISANDLEGSVNIRYTLTKYFDEDCNEMSNPQTFETQVRGFYIPLPTITQEVKTINLDSINDIVTKPSNLTIQLLKDKGVTVDNIFQFKPTNTDTKIDVKTFKDNTTYTWTMDEVQLTVDSHNPQNGTMEVTATINHGFNENLEYQTNTNFSQKLIIGQFKITNASSMTDNNEIELADDSLYRQTIPQLIMAHDKNNFLTHVKALIVENINNFVNFMPTQEDLKTPVADAIDVVIKDTYSNRDGFIDATISIKKVLNEYGEVIDADPDTFTKDIKIRGFKQILNPTNLDNVEINIDDIFANELDETKIKSYYPDIKNNNQSIPSINVDSNANLSTPSTINYVDKEDPKIVDGIKTVISRATLTGAFENNQDNTDIIFNPNKQLEFNVIFKGFKTVEQPNIQVDSILLENTQVEDVSHDLAQYYFMNFNPQNIQHKNFQTSTIEKLEKALNAQNLEILFGNEYKTLLPQDAKLKIKHLHGFDNAEGYLIADVYFDKIYDQFHNPMEQLSTTPNLFTYANIRLLGFEKITQATVRTDSVTVELQQDPIFGPSKIYMDQITDNDILVYLSEKDNPFMQNIFNTDKNGNPLTVNAANGQLIYQTQNQVIGQATIVREKNKVTVNFNLNEGVQNKNGQFIEVHPNYPSPYNEAITAKLEILFKDSGNTEMLESVANNVLIPGYVVDYRNVDGQYDNARIVDALKQLLPTPNDLFVTTGRADHITWDNLEVTVDTQDTKYGINGANGTIPLSINMTSGNYYVDGLPVDAVTTPIQFHTVIGTEKKSPISGFDTENKTLTFSSTEFESMKNLNINNKYAYEIMEEAEKGQAQADGSTLTLVNEIIKKIIDNPGLLIVDKNPATTDPETNKPYKQGILADLIDKNFTLTADNKNARILVTMQAMRVDNNWLYDEKGFLGDSKKELIIPETNMIINIEAEDHTAARKAKATKINQEYTVKGLSKFSPEEYIDTFYKGDINKFIYEDILWKEYSNFYDPNNEDIESANAIPLFEGLNRNIPKIKTHAEFKQWITVNAAEAVFDKGFITNIKVRINYHYFKDDALNTWVVKDTAPGNKNNDVSQIFTLTIKGFGNTLPPINWPIYVGIGVGVLGILSICLLIFAWVKHKSKRLSSD